MDGYPLVAVGSGMTADVVLRQDQMLLVEPTARQPAAGDVYWSATGGQTTVKAATSARLFAAR